MAKLNHGTTVDWSAMAYVAVWFCLNVGLTILNKAVFSNFAFPYPMTLSCVHYICSGIGAKMCMNMGGIKSCKLDYAGFKSIALFSLVFNFNILMGNASIKVVSVALSQTVRAVIPAATMMVTYFLLGTVYKKNVICSVLPVILGMMIACCGDVGNFTVTGMTILLLGCFTSGLKVVMTKVLLSGKNSFHPFDLLSKVTPFCVIQLIPIIYLVEFPSIMENSAEIPNVTIYAVLLTGVMAFTLNVTNFFTNRLVAPLTLTIVGNIKQVTTIMISIAIFHTSVTTINGVGIVITLFGGAYYSYVNRKRGNNNAILDKENKKDEVHKTSIEDIERESRYTLRESISKSGLRSTSRDIFINSSEKLHILQESISKSGVLFKSELLYT